MSELIKTFGDELGDTKNAISEKFAHYRFSPDEGAPDTLVFEGQNSCERHNARVCHSVEVDRRRGAKKAVHISRDPVGVPDTDTRPAGGRGIEEGGWWRGVIGWPF